jgi:hypothetical protein
MNCVVEKRPQEEIQEKQSITAANSIAFKPIHCLLGIYGINRGMRTGTSETGDWNDIAKLRQFRAGVKQAGT